MSETPIQPRAKVAFISGPIDTGPNAAYFHAHYKRNVDTAVTTGHNFVIGPITSGVDADALSYLLEYPIVPTRITIFMTISENRSWGEEFRRRGVNVYVLEDITATSQNRDAAMTAASDYDILRWRTEEEARMFYGPLYRPGYLTNTERNWRRRRGISFTAVLTEQYCAAHAYAVSADNPGSQGQGSSRSWLGRIKDKFK